MGFLNLFKSTDHYCGICGELANYKPVKLSDGYICADCQSKMYHIDYNGKTVAQIKDTYPLYKAENEMRQKLFNITKRSSVWVDEKNKLWCIPNNLDINSIDILSFDDLIDFELIEDGKSVVKSSGGLGRAIVGGILFGGAGAITGAATAKRKEVPMVSNLYLNISVNHPWFSNLTITYITSQTKKSGFLYRSTREIVDKTISILNLIMSSKELKIDSSFDDNFDKIRKLKELYDEGIITKEEFEAKKQQLLGI